MYAKNYISNST